MNTISVLFFSIFSTIAFVPVLNRLAVRYGAYDIPDDRKVHTRPVTRVGGVAIALGAVLPVLVFAPPSNTIVAGYLAGFGILMVSGIIDDLRGLDYKVKLAFQLAASVVAVIYGGIRIESLGALWPEILPGPLSTLLTVMVIVTVINAINFSDGLDGLASGICLLTFCFIAYMAYVGENTIILMLTIGVLGATFGFLRFNTFPALLFMGDTGSQVLGYSAVTLSIALTQGETALSPLLPLVLLGLPILDTISVIYKRISSGKSPFLPDSNHFHHQLIRMGLFQTEAVLAVYALQSLLILAAFLLRYYDEWTILIFYSVFSTAILMFMRYGGMRGIGRPAFLDEVIKPRLKEFREKGGFVRFSFSIIWVGVPALMIFTAFLPRQIPKYFSVAVLAIMIFLLAVWLFEKQWMTVSFTVSMYFIIPFVVYLGEFDRAAWFAGNMIKYYYMAFLIMAVFLVLTLKFTRRTKGFKTNPMDFLIISIVGILVLLSGTGTSENALGNMVAKIIMLYFSYEVIIGELRGNAAKIYVLTFLLFGVIVARGLTVL